MANGDTAVTAGMAKVAGTADRRLGYDEINLTRDYIATKAILVSSRTTIGKLLIEATTQANARSAIGAVTASEVVMQTQLAPGDQAVPNFVPRYNGIGQLTSNAPSLGGHVVPLSTLQGGFTTFGEVYLPNASPAVSGFTVCYINSDGRVSKGSSSERFKKYIRPIVGIELGDVWPILHKYQMRSLDGTGDGHWRYGWIAERLAENPDLEPFVVYDGDGRPESIDFISLLQVQTAALNERTAGLERRLAALEAALVAPENTDNERLSPDDVHQAG